MATLKIQSAEIEPFWATPGILLFLKLRFSNIFLTYMVWKYQNEIVPTFYYGISTKTNEKDLKIPTYFTAPWLKTSLVNVPVYCRYNKTFLETKILWLLVESSTKVASFDVMLTTLIGGSKIRKLSPQTWLEYLQSNSTTYHIL